MIVISDLYNAQIDTGLALLEQVGNLLDQMPEAKADGSNVNWGHVGKLLSINSQLAEVSYDLHKHLDYWRRKEAEHASPNA